MAELTSERHHWWPECVSRHWSNDDGVVHCLLPDGNERPASPPKNFGVITDGHFIKLGKTSGEVTPWDQNFEDEFDRADNNFPDVISWIQGLSYEARFDQEVRARHLPQAKNDEMFRHALEGIVSLAVRSPKTRESGVGFAKDHRGPLQGRERKTLIALNLRDTYKSAIASFGLRGKITAIYSPERELIFGDGFFQNLQASFSPIPNPRILAPLTPRFALLYAIPHSYSTDPNVFTRVVDAAEAAQLNHAVQIYARQTLFYSNERPELTDEFKRAEHLRYRSSENPIEDMVNAMPGVHSRGYRITDGPLSYF